MKDNFSLRIIMFVCVFLYSTVVFFFGAYSGIKTTQDNIESRADLLPDPGYETDCYSWEDIEFLIFGEIHK